MQINAKYEDKSTSHFASPMDKNNIIKFLVSKTANINSKDNSSKTPFLSKNTKANKKFK